MSHVTWSHLGLALTATFGWACADSSPKPPAAEPTTPAAAITEPSATAAPAAKPTLPEPEQLELTTEDGITLAGTLWRNPIADAPALVLVHQLNSNRDEWHSFVELLAERYTLLAIDLRGHGDSALEWKQFDDAAWAKIPLDVKASVTYLRQLETPPRAIGLAGGSIGSSAVLLYAAQDPHIAAVALLSPGTAYRGLQTEPAIQQLGGRPVLLVATTGDEAAATSVTALATSAANATAHVYDGALHGVSIAGEHPELLPAFATFFHSNLYTPHP